MKFWPWKLKKEIVDLTEKVELTLSKPQEPHIRVRTPHDDFFIAMERSRILDLQVIRTTLIEANIDTESLGEYIQKLEVWLEGYRDGFEQ